MKIYFEKSTSTVKVSFDDENYEQDKVKCQALKRIYTSEDFVVLLELMAQVEQRFDEAVMKVKPQEQNFREVAIYAARKNGFCEAMGLLKKAIEAYDFYLSERKKALDQQIDRILGQEEPVND